MITTVCTNRLNSVLIADYARPLYIPDGALVLDPTYGKGGWWRKFRPDRFVAHDLYKLDGVDFRALPEESGSVDVVAFDPPYVPPGGRETSTIKGMHDDYGMDTSPRTPALCRGLIADGIAECARVLKPRTGVLLVKSQDYVWGGRMMPGHQWALDDAGKVRGRTDDMTHMLERVDEFVHITGTGPQPKATKCSACKGSGCQRPPDCFCTPLSSANYSECPHLPEPCSRCDGVGKVERPQRHARAAHSFLTVFRRTRAR